MKKSIILLIFTVFLFGYSGQAKAEDGVISLDSLIVWQQPIPCEGVALTPDGKYFVPYGRGIQDKISFYNITYGSLDHEIEIPPYIGYTSDQINFITFSNDGKFFVTDITYTETSTKVEIFEQHFIKK